MSTVRSALVAACSLFGALAIAAVCPAQPPPQAPAQPPQAPSSPRPTVPSSLRPSARPVLVSPIDAKLDVQAAIEAAKKRAVEARARVLVVWVADPQAPFTQAMIDVINTADNRRIVDLEFAIVWADVGKGEHAAANRALAKRLGADTTPADTHPTLTILDQSGKPVISRNALDMVDPVRTNSYTAPVVGEFLSQHAEPAPLAQALADEAITKARESKRCVILCFGQYGDVWAWKFKNWLAQSDVAPVLAKHAVIAHIELLRDKGAFELLEKSGGVKVQTLPWFVVLNAEGKSVGTSQPEKMPNIGFPSDDVEITVFLALLHAGNPAFSDADAKILRDSLVAYGSRKGP